MRATSDTARRFGWESSMPARQRSAAVVANVALEQAALEQAAQCILDGLAAVARMAMLMVATAMDAARRWRLVNRNVRELSRLDDHLLKDIGLHRSEIVASAHRRVAELEFSGRHPYR